MDSTLSVRVDPEQLHIDALAGYCADASQKRLRDELIYCYEIFRRAFDTTDEAAWAALSKQYHTLICSWVVKFAAGRFDSDEVADLANDALAKFWRTLSTKLPLATHFKDTPQLLSYLNRCTVSVVYDVNRRQQSRDRISQMATLEAALPQHTPTIEVQISAEEGRTAQITSVRRWVDQHVTDEQEQLLLTLLFEEGLKPREVVTHCPEQFPDIRSVRRVRERILKRARRSPLFDRQSAIMASSK